MINAKTILSQNEEKELEVLCFILEQEEEQGIVVIDEKEVLDVNSAWEIFNGHVADFKYSDNNCDFLFVTMTSGQVKTLAQI